MLRPYKRAQPMKYRTKLSLLLLFLFLLPCIAVPADAALFTITSSGNGVFALSGTALSGVGTIEATIEYDTATLANPRVVQGGLVLGGMFVANTNSPGTVRIAVISPKDIAGSGVVAIVTFDRQGGSAGKILSLNPRLTDYVRWARECGYRRIGLTTNARRLGYEAYARRLLEAGLNHVVVSIHGPDARAHDAQTRTPGSPRISRRQSTQSW